MNHVTEPEAGTGAEEQIIAETERLWKLVDQLKRNVDAIGLEAVKAKRRGQAVMAEIDSLRQKLEPVWLRETMEAWPVDGATAEERRRLDRDVRAVMADCRKPGGLADRCRDALLERQGPDEYSKALNLWRLRLERDAFYPFWRRHCTVTEPPGFEIRNSLTGAIWRKGDDGKYAWYLDGTLYTARFPPGDVRKLIQAHGSAASVFEGEKKA